MREDAPVSMLDSREFSAGEQAGNVRGRKVSRPYGSKRRLSKHLYLCSGTQSSRFKMRRGVTARSRLHCESERHGTWLDLDDGRRGPTVDVAPTVGR